MNMDTTNASDLIAQPATLPIATGTVDAKVLPESRSIVLHDISWDQYTGMISLLGERRFRHTYFCGNLEIMSPSQKHEWESDLLGLLVHQMCITLDREFVSLGSWTINHPDIERGFEPDNCFYLTNEPAVRFKQRIDLDHDPPPDLAIEVDVTSHSDERLPLYAAIGVPEIWRYDGRRVSFLCLVGKKYVSKPQSLAFTFLTPAKLEQVLGERGEKTELKLVKEFVNWVRGQNLELE